MKNLDNNKWNADDSYWMSSNQQWAEDEIEWWNLKKEKLKKRFPFLSDEDLRYNHSSEKMMMMLLCYKLHMTKEMLGQIISAL